MINELKKLLIPKKLWILRLYIALLTFIVEFLLGAYVVVSIYNLIASDNALGDLILGYAGLYLVWICLAILFVIQVVSMFLNIHDNIEDVRNKAVNPDFAINLEEEKEKGRDAKMRSIATIAIIILSIILSFVNLNRENKNNGISYQENAIQKEYEVVLNQIFAGWEFLTKFKSIDNLNENARKEVCDEDYCFSFVQFENLVIASYEVKNSIEAVTKVYDMNQKKIIDEGKFYVDDFHPSKGELTISKQGLDDNGRFFLEGKVNLFNMELEWENKQY